MAGAMTMTMRRGRVVIIIKMSCGRGGALYSPNYTRYRQVGPRTAGPASSVGGDGHCTSRARENICGGSTGGRGRHVRRAGDRGGVTWRQRGQWLAIRAHAARVRPRYFVRRAAAGAGGAGTRGRLSGGGSRSAAGAGDTWSVRDARGVDGWLLISFVKSCGCRGRRGPRGCSCE
jgi:hypothetical protein